VAFANRRDIANYSDAMNKPVISLGKSLLKRLEGFIIIFSMIQLDGVIKDEGEIAMPRPKLFKNPVKFELTIESSIKKELNRICSNNRMVLSEVIRLFLDAFISASKEKRSSELIRLLQRIRNGGEW